MPDTSKEWDGGYIRTDARGRRTYIIRRTVGGHRYDVSTRCATSSAAHEQLKRFEADPVGYRPEGAAELVLGEDLARAFLHWSIAPRPEGAGNTREWVTQQRLYLAWWANALAGIDLRRATLGDHILPALEGCTARPHRIAVLKRLYSWLRTVRHLIAVDQDPTFGQLSVPQSTPEQWVRVKAISREDYLAVRAALPSMDYAFQGGRESPYGFRAGAPSKFSLWRDALDLLAATGWHVSELARFVKRGQIEAHPKIPGLAVLVCPQTKGGRLLRTSAAPEIIEAARRMLEHGSFTRARFAEALRRAQRVAGVKAKVTPGIFRHSVATAAINSGATIEQVAGFLDHQTKRTTRRLYATHSVPAKVPTLND